MKQKPIKKIYNIKLIKLFIKGRASFIYFYFLKVKEFVVSEVIKVQVHNNKRSLINIFGNDLYRKTKITKKRNGKRNERKLFIY